jgi:hypothetical protein
MAWVLAWILFLRFHNVSPALKYALTVPAVLTPLLAAAPAGAKIFLILTVLNIASYGVISLLDRSNRLARHLIFASVLTLAAALPDHWLQTIAPGMVQAQCVAAGLMAYLIFWTAWLRSPKLAVLGAILFGSAIMSVTSHHAGAGYWAWQGGFIFLLLHSLRWNDQEHPGTGLVRMLAGLVWVIQSFVWMHSETGRFWMPFIPGAVVLGVYCACQIRRGQWQLPVVPAAAILVILSGPFSAMADGVRTAPTGLLAVIGSFLLFGLGTATALTRHHWHKHDHDLETDAPRTPEVNR